MRILKINKRTDKNGAKFYPYIPFKTKSADLLYLT